MVEFSPRASIGKNFKLSHGVGTVIGGDTRIGDNCVVYNGVTFGVSGRGKWQGNTFVQEDGCPTVGNNCIFYPRSRVIGKISIGDCVTIGANVVVACDVPSGSIVRK